MKIVSRRIRGLLGCALLANLALAACSAAATPTDPLPTLPETTPTLTARASEIPSPTATRTVTPVPPTRTPRVEDTPTATQAALEGEPIVLQFIEMVNSSMGWGFSRDAMGVDRVLETIDGGQTWRDVSPPVAAPEQSEQTKTALGYFPNSSTAWIIYQVNPSFFIPDELNVWYTTDRGRNWTTSAALAIPPDSEFHELSDLHFIDPRNGWLISHVGVGMNHDYFTMFATTDAGESWQLVVDPFMTPDIQGCLKTALSFVNASTGWLTVDCQGVLAGAFIYQTVDGGISWETIQRPTQEEDPSLFSRAFCGTHTPLWSAPESGTVSLKCVPEDDFTAEENYIYRTEDGGLSWQILPMPEGDLLMLDDQVGWALSSDIHQTLDGGRTWNYLSTVTWEGQFSFTSRLAGWAIASDGEENALVRTSDGGISWQLLEPVLIP